MRRFRAGLAAARNGGAVQIGAGPPRRPYAYSEAPGLIAARHDRDTASRNCLVSRIACHQALDISRIRGIPHEEFVVSTQPPEIAGQCDRSLCNIGNGIFIGEPIARILICEQAGPYGPYVYEEFGRAAEI